MYDAAGLSPIAGTETFAIAVGAREAIAFTAEEYLARSRELVASAPELHGFARKSYYAPQAVLAAVTFAGVSTEGSEYEWELLMVGHADGEGRYLRLEYFSEDQWTQALERFDVWSNDAVDRQAGTGPSPAAEPSRRRLRQASD